MTATTTERPLRERYVVASTNPDWDDSIPGVKEARTTLSRAESVLYGWQRKSAEARKMRASKKKDVALADAAEQVEVARMAVELAKSRLAEITEPVELQRHLELVRIQTELVQAAFLMGGAKYLHKTPEDWGVAILDEPSFEYIEGEHGPVFAIDLMVSATGRSPEPPQWLRIKLSFQRDVRYEVAALLNERDEHNPLLKKEWFTGGQVILRTRRYGEEDERVEVSFPSVSYQPVPEAIMAGAVVAATVRLAMEVERLLGPDKED